MAKISGHEGEYFEGPAVVFEDEGEVIDGGELQAGVGIGKGGVADGDFHADCPCPNASGGDQLPRSAIIEVERRRAIAHLQRHQSRMRGHRA